VKGHLVGHRRNRAPRPAPPGNGGGGQSAFRRFWSAFQSIGGQTESEARKSKRRKAGRGTETQTCQSCRRHIGVQARRCPHCGSKLKAIGPSELVQPAAHPGATSPGPNGELTELQKRILLAARSGRRGKNLIYVLPPLGAREGEIKAGDERLYGNEAVDTVTELVGRGYVAPQDDNCFSLTDAGERLAADL